MRAPLGGPTLFLWHGRALMVGRGIDSSPHAHYAAQLSLALDAPVRVRAAEGDWVATEAAVFAPNSSHQLDCGGAAMAHLFVELAPRACGLETTFAAGFHRDPRFVAVRAALEQARRGTLDEQAASHAARQWMACALPPPLPPAWDERIAGALAWIAAHPDARPSGAFLAARAHLSQSRFTHLFRQQTGMPLSRYLLWTRLVAAVEAVASGHSMTVSAHHAGFADLAHLSRTFRASFWRHAIRTEQDDDCVQANAVSVD